MYCYARTDPRMRTFDGESWVASLAGEFVMYRDIRRQIAVSIRKKHVFPDYDKWHMADVTGQQRVLTPEWHLILPLIYYKVLVCSAPVLYFLSDFRFEQCHSNHLVLSHSKHTVSVLYFFIGTLFDSRFLLSISVLFAQRYLCFT